MERESIYKNYVPADSTPNSFIKEPHYWFIFKNEKMLINKRGNNKIPLKEDLNDFNIISLRNFYLGRLNDKPCFSVEVGQDTKTPQTMLLCDLRNLYQMLDEDQYLLAGKALQIINWDKNHQFCGRCGSTTVTSEYERAKICTECSYKSYPRLSPAVITAIIKEGKILMAKHGYREKMYGLIAGFVEPGETLEEAVTRETWEEVRIKVKKIKYFGSQPWPYPHSLMVGFTAEYDDGEIEVDGKEIVDANWFSPEDIARIPSKLSIARELIDWFISKRQIG